MDKDNTRSNKINNSNEGIRSFDDIKNKVIEWVFKHVPSYLRIPLIIIIFIAPVAYSTHSHWLPIVKIIMFEQAESIIMGGYIYLKEDKPLRLEVQLLNSSGKIVGNAFTDINGYATFNISSNVKIGNILCNKDGEWLDFPITDYKLLKNERTFRIFLEKKRIEIP